MDKLTVMLSFVFVSYYFILLVYYIYLYFNFCNIIL
jgi:hypothetical protein